jgi:hypothetical protein
MISAPVAIGHLDRFRAVGQRKDLVAKADAEDRNARIGDLLDRFRRVVDSRGITRPVRQENAVRFQLQDIGRRSFRGDYGDVAILLGEQTQDVSP